MFINGSSFVSMSNRQWLWHLPPEQPRPDGFSNGQASGPMCVTVNGLKVATGHTSDLQGGVLLINGAQNSSIHDDVFAANTGLGVGDGGNGFYFNPCTNQNQPFTAEPAMGGGNTFTNTCYANTDVPGLPPTNQCK